MNETDRRCEGAINSFRAWLAFFFYANEGNEPIHIHCRKGDMECKYWLDVENYDIAEAYSYNMNNKDKREVKKIIFEYFEFIEQEWDRFKKKGN